MSDQNGDSILKVVELFVANINESTKTVIRDLDKISTSLDDLNKQSNTPPRNKELEDDHKTLNEGIASILLSINDIKESVNSMIKTIKIAVSLFGLAVLIGSLIMTFGGIKSSVPTKNQQVIIEQRLENIEKFIKEK